MLIFNKQSYIIEHLTPFWASKTRIGFVPTMGALHAGHLSLLAKSLENNALTVISIFVNPTQFNNPDDLAKYPRTIERDIEQIESLSKNIIVFAPSVEDIYAQQIVSETFLYDGLENQMEGKHRPGHFDGVGTIVKRLLEIVKPTNAYFGEKDFQQLQIVKKLVQKNNIPVQIIGCPIHREANGLALSSRNERLSPTERSEAALIFKTLKEAKERFGTKSAIKVTAFVENVFKNHATMRLEYFEIADENTLKTCTRKSKNKQYRAFIAIFVNNIRLIDTISLN